MKKVTILLVLVMTVLSMSAQQKETQPTWKNEFGLQLGATTGMGLSYRHWFGRAGVQITTLPIKTQDLTMVSAGATFLYTFREMAYTRFYGYVGNHFWKYKNDKKDIEQYNLGFGPALAIGKTLRFNIMAGYAVFDVGGDAKLLPTGEVGLYYNF